MLDLIKPPEKKGKESYGHKEKFVKIVDQLGENVKKMEVWNLAEFCRKKM